MAEKTYNLKLTAKELYHLQWGMECLRDNFEEGTDYYNESKKVVENLEKRFEKKDYTEICWGKKTNETLKKKIAKLEADNKRLKESCDYLHETLINYDVF